MVKTDSLRMTPVEWVLLVILAGFWGGTFFFNALALPEIPPFTVITVRVFLAALILWVVVRFAGVEVPRDRSVWTALVVMAFANSAFPFFLIAWGQLHITSGLAGILIATAPLFGVLVAHYFSDDEAMTPMKLIGVMVGLAGVVILIGPGFLSGLGANLHGQFALLGAALLYAMSATYARRFSRQNVSPMIVATGQMTLATIMLLPFALIFDRPWELPLPSLTAASAVVALAVLSTSVAYLIYFRILATAGATNILLVNFMVPVSALLLGVFVLGEILTAVQLVGMAGIAFGLALIDGRMFRLFVSPR